MQKNNILPFAARLLTVLLAISPFSMPVTAHAQTGDLQVNIPFAFESGDTHFGPGVYRIHMSASTPVIRIEGTKSSAFQMTMPGSSTLSPKVSKVVFRRYGSRYILKQVWTAGNKNYVRTPNSKVEKQLELEQAQAESLQTQDQLALLATVR